MKLIAMKALGNPHSSCLFFLTLENNKQYHSFVGELQAPEFPQHHHPIYRPSPGALPYVYTCHVCHLPTTNCTHTPTTYMYQNYLVTHINTLQAMVLVQHVSGQFNLYLSDTTGVDYSLTLRDIVVDFSNNYIDVEWVGW